jgi:uncharacterized protein YecT (DUF1311 family)
MKALLKTSVILMLLAPLAWSDTPPQNHDKCSNPGGEQDRAICLERDYQAADAELNRAYEALQERISETERKSLTRAERAWIKRRDAQCEVETSVGVETGQFPHSEAVRGCCLDMTETRTDTVSGGYETQDLPHPSKSLSRSYRPMSGWMVLPAWQ